MAVHLLEGHKVGGRRQSQALGQREKLLALGTITAGLTHQLNNPAAATARAVADLREGVGKMRHKLAMLADGKFTPRGVASAGQHPGGGGRTGRQVQGAGAHRAGGVRPGRPASATGSRTTASRSAWEFAPTFVEACLDIDWLERISASVDAVDATASLQSAIGWLKYTIDTELRMNEIADASKRISALVAGAKQYSQMDRAPYQVANVHELLHGTLKTLFGDKVGSDKPIKLVKEWDKSIPEISCYPSDLNELWDIIITNAVQAMKGHGTLTIRTARQDDDMIRVEIGDDGPGISEENISRIFTPFFTTKPVGEGTGLGLDLARRIVVEKHHGDIRVESEPGTTRFIILLPLVAPAPLATTPTKLPAPSE